MSLLKATNPASYGGSEITSAAEALLSQMRAHGVIIGLEQTTNIPVPGLGFEFWYYENISHRIEVNYEAQDVKGRSEPFLYYQNTSAARVEFPIFLISEEPYDEGVIQGRLEMLKSFVYPTYLRGPGVIPPMKVLLSMGSLFLMKQGRIMGYDVEYRPPFSVLEHLPGIVQVNLSFQCESFWLRAPDATIMQIKAVAQGGAVSLSTLGGVAAGSLGSILKKLPFVA